MHSVLCPLFTVMGVVGWFGGGDGLELRLVVLRRIPVIDWLGDLEFRIG